MGNQKYGRVTIDRTITTLSVASMFRHSVSADIDKLKSVTTNHIEVRDLIFAAINLNFATELLLKCLLEIKLSVQPPQSHDLTPLYRNLPKETRDEIEREFAKSVGNQAADNHAIAIKLSVAWDDEPFPEDRDVPERPQTAANCLAEANGSYVAWRYIFRSDTPRQFTEVTFNFRDLSFICDIVEKMIAEQLETAKP
jgi:HEPN domain-containing protein